MNEKAAIQTFMGMAKLAAENSTCSGPQVGCILTTEDNILLGEGFNGAPKGMLHCCDQTHERVPGECDCLHAEVNAIIWCKEDPRVRKIAYVTLSPCLNCIKMLRAFGVYKIYYMEQYRSFALSNSFAERGNVQLVQVLNI